MGLSAWLARGWNPLRGREKPQLGRGGAAAPPALPEDTPTAGPYPAKAFRSVIVLVVVLGGALLGLFAFKQTAQPPSRFAVFSVTMMLAAAAVAVGGLLGFLFGIPRSVQEPRPLASSQTPETTDERGVYGVNTNLEQISDWLTKILVGVGLIQLGRTSRPLGRLVASIADGLGGQPIDRLMVGGILVFFSIFGFLASYLLTRLLLQRAFTVADLSAVVAVATSAASQQVQRQQQLDADAYSLVARTLQPPAGASPPSQKELNQVLQKASPVVRSQVFSLARNQRLADEKTAAGRKNLVRTVLVFRALIAAEPDPHRNHGQLAYALRYAIPPALDEAEQELNRAIALRDAAGETGGLIYELNRAALRTEQDLQSTAPVPPERKASILADLRAAAKNPALLAEIYKDDSIQTWLRANAPDEAELLKP